MVKKFKNVEVVNENSPPEQRLAVMRAQQMVGQCDPNEYEKVRKEVINNKNSKTKELWQTLEEDYECEVCELEFEDKKTYGVKIRTPDGTFIDFVTKAELLDFMKPYKKSNLKIISRVINYFKIASLKCACCGELGAHLEGNDKVQIIKEAEFYGIKTVEDWEIKMGEEMNWVMSNKEIIRHLLRYLPKEWDNSKKTLKEIYKQTDQNGIN